LLVIQNRNFDAVLDQRDRWMGPQAEREGDREWLFLRFYDFDPDGLLTFNVVTLRRAQPGEWRQKVTSTRLWPLTQRELIRALDEARFQDVRCFGDLRGTVYDAQRSPNLVVTAHKRAPDE
jgi:hypothetical protein